MLQVKFEIRVDDKKAGCSYCLVNTLPFLSYPRIGEKIVFNEKWQIKICEIEHHIKNANHINTAEIIVIWDPPFLDKKEIEFFEALGFSKLES